MILADVEPVDFANLKAARDEFTRVSRGYWQFLADVDENFFVVDRFSAWAGDCNCPYDKPYDPKDGHGHNYFSIDLDELVEDKEFTLASVLEKATARIAEEWPHAAK